MRPPTLPPKSRTMMQTTTMKTVRLGMTTRAVTAIMTTTEPAPAQKRTQVRVFARWEALTLEAVEQLEVRETFPMSLPVPDCGDVHKARIAKWLAGEVPTLTADRNRRVAQIHSDEVSNEAQVQAKLSDHDWWVGQGDDIAVLFADGKYWIGRVMMVKRRFKTKGGKATYVQYKNRVVINEGREDLGDLLFHCHWYEAEEHTIQVGRKTTKETRYKFNVSDVDPVELSNVICPRARWCTMLKRSTSPSPKKLKW